MAKDLTSKIALVTGGSRNIGRETALALARQGADVVITYRERADAAQRTVDELQSLGARAAAIRADLAGTAQIDRLVAEFTAILRGWGAERFHILVNNAGTMRMATFDRVTEEDLDANFLTNYKSVFFLTQKLLDRLADGGRIVNLGSGLARHAFAPLVAYGPIKAALQALTVYLAGFLGRRGITVNAVAPGGLDDEFNAPLFDAMPQARGHIAQSTALGRIGVPADVPGAIVFLCSPQAGFISGATIPIDGGYKL